LDEILNQSQPNILPLETSESSHGIGVDSPSILNSNEPLVISSSQHNASSIGMEIENHSTSNMNE
jgi:hypothetical protein